MAGVDALTMPPEMIEELAARKDFSTNKWEARSRFLVSDDNSNSNGIHSSNANANADREEMTFVNDKAKFLELFSQNARGKAKTDDVSKPNDDDDGDEYLLTVDHSIVNRCLL